MARWKSSGNPADAAANAERPRPEAEGWGEFRRRKAVAQTVERTTQAPSRATTWPLGPFQ